MPLLERELAVMGEELTASREKIATLVLMWMGIKSEPRQAEAELSKARRQLNVSALHDRKNPLTLAAIR